MPQGLDQGRRRHRARCSPKASATRSASRSPPIRSRRRRPGARCSKSLGLRERKGLDLIACPSCGRAEVDVIRVAADAQAALEARNIPLQVAVMGCVVNGPGEAREADLGIAAGRGKGHLFVKGQVVRVVPEARDGRRARRRSREDHGRGHRSPARGRRRRTRPRSPTATRDELLQIQGVDANHSAENGSNASARSPTDAEPHAAPAVSSTA